jgi:hypothetical protein
MPYADFQPSNAGSQVNADILRNVDFAQSMMERATRNATLLQDVEQRKQRFVQDAMLGDQQIQQGRLRLSQMEGEQAANAARNRAAVAESDANFRRMAANESLLESAASEIDTVVKQLEEENDPDALEAGAASFLSRYSRLANDKDFAARFDSLAQPVASIMATKGSALRQRIVAASRALLPALDRTDPMQLSASVARVKSSPFFEVAQRDPVFQKAYAEAEKAAFDFQAKAAAEKQKSDLKIAEDTAASKNKIAETQAKGESDKKEAPQYLVEKSTKVAQSSNDLDDLAAQFKNQSTGPVVGFLRELNPYDTSAQTFRAKLFATVPNLARGVFNEVGVLTDSDVQNYLRTLPNLKTPQDRGEALIAQLRQVLERQRSNLKSVIEGQGYKTGGLTGLLAPTTAQPALIRTPEDLAKAKAEKLARQGSR